MYDECAFVLQHTAQQNFETVTGNKVLMRALERSIEIIGEAAKKVEDDFKARHPHIEWRKMAGTRDRLIHHYFGIDYDIFWDIVQHKIPELYGYLTEIMEELQQGDN